MVRDQLFPQKPLGSRFRFLRTGVQPSPGSSTIELPSAFAESGAYPPDRELPALHDSAPCLSRALPKANILELGRGAHLKTPSSANHTAAASQPTGRIAKAARWLHLSRVSPVLKIDEESKISTGPQQRSALVWRMAHRRTGVRGGKHGEMTDNLASLVSTDFRKPPKYGRVFSTTASKKFLRLYAHYERGVKQSNKEQTMKCHVLSMSELLQNHFHACLSRTFGDRSSVGEEKLLREALARHYQCWEEDEVDPCRRGLKALASRLEVTALDSVEAACSSLEGYFALNASIKRVF